jgi:hypothetical protein
VETARATWRLLTFDLGAAGEFGQNPRVAIEPR